MLRHLQSPTTIIVLIILYAAYLNQKEGAWLLTLNNKLPLETQTLIKAVKNAQKQKTPTNQGIIEELDKLTSKQTDKV
jgi:hypothetical protein